MANSSTNKVRFGLSEIHYAVATEADDGTITYGEWKSLPRAVSIDVSENSSTVTKYADNILQFQASVVSSKSLTLNVSQVCDDFKVDCLGYKKTSGGGLLQVVDGAKPLFALGFMVKGDRNKAKKVFLKCLATGFTDDNNATDTDAGPTFADDSVSIVAYPTKSGTSNVISYSTVEGNSDYDDLFSTTLTVPTAAA